MPKGVNLCSSFASFFPFSVVISCRLSNLGKSFGKPPNPARTSKGLTGAPGTSVFPFICCFSCRGLSKVGLKIPGGGEVRPEGGVGGRAGGVSQLSPKMLAGEGVFLSRPAAPRRGGGDGPEEYRRGLSTSSSNRRPSGVGSSGQRPPSVSSVMSLSLLKASGSCSLSAMKSSSAAAASSASGSCSWKRTARGGAVLSAIFLPMGRPLLSSFLHADFCYLF